jgi:hypothetical protein
MLLRRLFLQWTVAMCVVAGCFEAQAQEDAQ